MRSPGEMGERPGGGRELLGCGERKVRRGLEGIGVPSSSSGVGGGGAHAGGSLEEVEGCVPVAVALCGVRFAERVWKNGCCCSCC